MLQEQLEQLKVDGWSEKVLGKVYRMKVMQQVKSQDSPVDLNQYLEEARTFGSPIFIAMWRYESRRANHLRARALLQLVMSYVKMPSELSGGSEEACDLLSCFASGLTPHSRFWQYFARVVKKAYPKESFLQTEGDLPLKRQLHQFRYVISAQQAQWVRENYGQSGFTDGQALARYLSHLPASLVILRRLLRRRPAYQLRVSSRLHNKLALSPNGDIHYPDGERRYNFKVLIGFHTEFILNDQGSFLNELDPEGSSLAAIVNGASFNYAGLSFRDHKIFDVRPVSLYDPDFRRRASSQQGRRYKNPNRKTYTNRSDQVFGDGQRSLQDHVNGVVRIFKKLIKASKQMK